MLKPGLIFIGQPSIHLHEMLSLALYLEAPIAFSEETSYQIAQKFAGIIPVHKLSESFSLHYFVSGIKKLFTNLQPEELEPFFIAHPEAQKLEVLHIIEGGLKYYKNPPHKLFCSSFLHTKQLIPLESQWLNLGAIGPLSYKKHKKALLTILNSFLPKADGAKFFLTQILPDADHPKITKESTLDQIQFINLSFSSLSSGVIPAHGLIDACIDTTQGCLIYDEALSLIALHHKKPLLIKEPLKGTYQELSPLLSLMPKDPLNLVPLIENYFDFETINRSELIHKGTDKFFHKPLFSA